MKKSAAQNNLLIYKNKEGNIVVDAIYKDETLWLTQKGMAKVFDVGVSAISKHLKNIFAEEELNESMVVSKMENTTQHGAIKDKTQINEVKIYNLDAINAVDYRVNFIYLRWMNFIRNILKKIRIVVIQIVLKILKKSIKRINLDILG